MIAIWYGLVSFMLILYVVLDGRNFGVGIMHWLVARTPEERRQVVAAVGPLYSWDEVWLIGFGGTLLAIFPRVMGTAFAGYYLALFMILWCLILRAMALEVGGHINDRMWQAFWDFILVFSSCLLAILFGAAGGNVLRGVPLDEHGNFSMALFTDFGVRGQVGILDWYTVSVGVFAFVMMAAHGASYLELKTEGSVHDRSAKYARWLWAAGVPLLLVVSIETWVVRPDLPARAFGNPICWIGFLMVAGSIFAVATGLLKKNELRVFMGSNLIVVGMLGTAAAAIFPNMLLSTLEPDYSLTAYNSNASADNLWIAAVWWPAALVLTLSYFFFISRYYYAKVKLERDTQGLH